MTQPGTLGATLLGIARVSIEAGVRTGSPAPPPDPVGAVVAGHRASFVTLRLERVLRGCVGTLVATRPLVEDVHLNAFNAAFRDPRFAPVSALEVDRLDISISVLGELSPLPFDNEAALLRALAIGEDGLLIRDADRQATFLPSVWQQLDDPRTFLAALKRKAGIAPDNTAYEALRYRCEHFGSGAEQDGPDSR